MWKLYFKSILKPQTVHDGKRSKLYLKTTVQVKQQTVHRSCRYFMVKDIFQILAMLIYNSALL